MLAILAASGCGWLRVGPRDPLSQFPFPRARRVAGFEAQPQTLHQKGAKNGNGALRISVGMFRRKRPITP